MMKKYFILLLFLLSSCGYQPLFTLENPNNFIFNKINLTGDNEINRKIISALSFKENSSDNSLNTISLESKKEISATSKNSKGQITSFKTTVNLTVVISADKKVLKRKVFMENFSYSNLDNKFDLAEYQNQVENNLVEKIIEELIIFINL
tara:strand:- start:449 stop:898 length:450 start_codon:yes stop_codon:yes gene_type:complete